MDPLVEVCDFLSERERYIEKLEVKLAEAQAEFLSWNEAQASGRELELEAKLADALVKADCGATTPEPCRLSPPCLTCYTVAKDAEVERLRAVLDFLRRCDTKDEIVSTGRLTELQIANARAAGTMYVEPGGGLGWVVRPSGPAPAWVGQQEAQEWIAELNARHLKHPTGDYCVYCLSQWPCEDSLRGGGE